MERRRATIARLTTKLVLALCLFLAVTAGTFVASSASAHAAPFDFLTNHQLYDRGADIRSLQEFFNTHGFLIAQSGPGSSGNETSFFGLATFQALKDFQAAHGLPSTGFFGPLTRAAINSGSAASSTVVQTTTPATSIPTGAVFTHALNEGQSGADITELQQILIKQGFLGAGDDTGYFGPLTTKAVAAFQTAHNLDPLGGVGPLTRALLNSLLSTVASSQSAPSTTFTPATTTTASTSTTTPNSKALPGYQPGQIIFGGGGGSSGGGGGGGSSSATPADTTPPSTPANLSATVTSPSQINLSWSASTDNVAVTGYNVYRDGTLIGTATANNYSDTGLAPSTLHSYWVSAVDSSNNVSTTTGGVSSQTSYGADQYGTTWKPLRIGAGGFITDMDIVPDGTRVIRTDTYGAYIWDSGQWDQLISTSTMPTAFVNTQLDDTGVYGIAIAPSDSNDLYMEFKGYLLTSTNRGSTWTKTSFPQTTDGSGQLYRYYGEHIAVDPVNPSVVLVGTPNDGVWISSNGGSTWTQISAVGTSTHDTNGGYYGHAIAFDPTSSVVSGKTQGIYVATYGTGIYHSTNGGQTWTLLNSSGMPTTFRHMVVDQNGNVWVTEDASTGVNSNLDKYSAGAWGNLNVNASGGNQYRMVSIAINPTNANDIYLGIDSGDLDFSTNGGSTWSGVTFGDATAVSTDIPWLAWAQNAQSTGNPYFDNGNMVFDPTASNTLYMAAGIGVWHTNPPTTAQAFQWDSQSTGIEQLVSNEIISPPGGQPLVSSWDRAVFTITNPDVYPSTYGPTNAKAIDTGWSADWASNDPSYIVGVIEGDAEELGYSTNSGQTWSNFPSVPGAGLNGGSIAVASSTDIVWVPANAQPYYSLDGGQTWTQITTATSSGWTYSFERQIVAADRVNIGTFYMYVNGNLFRSTNGGVTWSQIQSNFGSPWGGFNAKLRAMPNVAGELFFTGGPQSPNSTSSPQAEPFEMSTNGGTTWTTVPNVLEVYDFGFGKAAAGTTTPTIYIAGFVNNKFGIYESDNNAGSWTQIGLWPFGSLDLIRAISGDMNAYGRVYVGFTGSGYAYGNTASAEIPPIISSISSGTPTSTAATITWSTDQSSHSKVVYGTTNAYGSVSSNVSLVTSLSITLTGLSGGTTYHYAVVSANAQGYTATSTDQTFTTVNNTPPSVPTGLTATATSSSEIDLSWTASTGDGTYSVAGYQIFRNGLQVGTTTSGTIFADTGLAASTTYGYVVDAYDTHGNVSAQSGSVNTTTQAGVTFTPTADPPIQYIGYSSNTATFSNVSIGTASSNRLVVVGVGNNNGNNNGGIASVMIGGISATEATTSDPGKDRASLWYATVPTGATTTIVVVCNTGAFELAGILVGDITGASSATPTANGRHPSDSIADPQAIPSSGSITVPKNGIAVVFGNGNSTGTQSISWTGASSASGDWYTHNESGNTQSDVMAHSYKNGSNSFTVAGSIGSGFGYNGFAGVVAAWGP